MARAALVVAALALLAGCNGPVMVLPGGQLDGTVTAAPDTWSEVPETVQLETRPADPYSVNIWALAIGRHLYVATSAEGTEWSSFIQADPRVRVRMDEVVYELTATEVFDLDERRRVAAGYVTKYDIDAEDNWVAEGLIVRLDRR